MADAYNVKINLEARDNASEKLSRLAARSREAQSDLLKLASGAGKVVTSVGISLAGALGYSIKQAANFERGMSRVKAVSGASGVEFDKLSAKAREMGAKTSFSATEAADGLYYMALAGWDTHQMLAGIEPVLHLAEAGALDLGRASDLVTDSMAALGIEVEDLTGYLDKIAQTARRSNTDIDQLMEAFIIAGGTFRRFNIPLEEANAFLGILANRGFKGSEAGTALNAIMDRLTSGTGQAAKALEKMGISAFDSEGNFKGMEKVMYEVRDALEDMDDETRAHYQSMISGLHHTKAFSAILNGLGEEYQDLKADIVDSDGALREMRDTMKDNLQGAIENLISAIEEVAISTGSALLPAIRWVTEALLSAVNVFNNFSDTTKSTIAISGAVAAALMLIVGPLAMIAPFLPVIAAGFSAILSPVGLLVIALGIGGLAGAFIAVKKAQEDAIPPVERFGKQVSETTQEAVGAYMDLSEKANIALKELAWSQETVTKESANRLIEQQKELTAELITAIDERHKKEVEVTKKHLSQLEELDEGTKQDILAKTDEYYDEQRKKAQEGEKRVIEILEKAVEEKRELTDEEFNEINKIRAEGLEQAVSMMTENELEQKVIMERMKENAELISAHEAAAVAKNAIEKKNEVVKEAEEQFEETYAWAIRQRDELGTLSEEQAQEIIDNARKERDKTIAAAEERHENIIKEAKKQAGEHVESVDWETGEILTKWEKFDRELGKIRDWIGKKKMEWSVKIGQWMINAWEYVTTEIPELFRKMKTKVLKWLIEKVENIRKKYEEIKENMLRPIRIAKEKIEGFIDDIKGFFANLRLKLPKIELPKLPRFTLKGKFSLRPPSVPKIGVRWNARGGLFRGPTVVPTPYGLQGFGEAGPEAALPLTRSVLSMIGDRIAETMQLDERPSLDYSTPPDTVFDAATTGVLDRASGDMMSVLVEIRDELRKQKQLIIEMDNRTVGRLVEPYVTEEQERNQGILRSFRGGG